jgi:AMMECR1 domain-containing protein
MKDERQVVALCRKVVGAALKPFLSARLSFPCVSGVERKGTVEDRIHSRRGLCNARGCIGIPTTVENRGREASRPIACLCGMKVAPVRAEEGEFKFFKA